MKLLQHYLQADFSIYLMLPYVFIYGMLQMLADGDFWLDDGALNRAVDWVGAPFAHWWRKLRVQSASAQMIIGNAPEEIESQVNMC